MPVRQVPKARLLSFAAALCCSATAMAQSTGPQVVEITAQKRSENIRDVPLPVTAISGAALEERLKQGTLPEWDPTIYSGMSYVGNVQSGLFYPPNWWLHWINHRRTGMRFFTIEILLVFHYWLAFFFAWRWLRRHTRGDLPALLGAALYGFSGYGIAEAQHQVADDDPGHPEGEAEATGDLGRGLGGGEQVEDLAADIVRDPVPDTIWS